MTRTRLVPALILTLLLSAGVSWGQTVPASTPAPYPSSIALPYYQQLPQVLFAVQADGAGCCEHDGDMVSLLVADCLKMWALLWQDGKYPEAGTMANEACRLDPNCGAAEYARFLSQIANTTRYVHPAAGCPRSCYAVPVQQPFGLANSFEQPTADLLFGAGINSNTCLVGGVKQPPKPTAAASSCGGKTCETCPAKPAKPCVTCPGQAEECDNHIAAAKGCACAAKPAAVKKSCACDSGCCNVKKACVCENDCCRTKQTCACSNKCCNTCCKAKNSCACGNNAETGCACCACCAKHTPAKKSCSCCTNCSCGKSSSISAPADAATCTFLRLMQRLPPLQDQPSHPVIIMSPMPAPAQPPMPATFMPHLPYPLQHAAPPGMPMVCPSMPRPAELIHDQVFVPVVRPQPPQAERYPVQFPVPLSMFGSRAEEMIPPPTVMPSQAPNNMPLQITATGKRVKVSCHRFEARCNRISHLPSGDRIVLEGKVRLTFKGNNAGKVSAERVEVDMGDGAVEVNPPPAPSRSVVPVGYYTPVSRMAPPCEP